MTPLGRTRTVAGRLFGSYVLVILAFAITTGWSFRALRAGARDAELLRAGYVPLLLRIGEALAEQNIFNAQLNHITAAKNSADVRDWMETERRTRPFTFSQVRQAAERGLGGDADPAVLRFRDDIAREVAAVEKLLDTEPERFSRLYQALALGDREAAERARDAVVKREAEGAQHLRTMKARVEEAMENLTAAARRRQERSVQLLVGLGLLTLLVGIMTSLYARRVLAPLSAVTARAKAVARGDLTPHEVVATNDEIGELATTFEGMVAAIQRARSELVQAERLATIGKMAAHVTHEIRNPLSSIALNVELLEDDLALASEESRELLRAIRREVERLTELSGQYLSFARRGPQRLEVEDLREVVGEAAEFMRRELEQQGVSLEVLNADRPVPATVDEAQIKQALYNLMRNAREAMPSGGKVTVSVNAAAGGGSDVIVEDEGVGLDEATRARLFEPFFTTKSNGTGLGLAITRQIIEAHGGSIACEPKAPRGTRIWIHLAERGSLAPSA